ncbi:MAG TPA: hypothetical protein VL947_08700 [Cytophagales bacterium]|nr:hypothetical protein [Cytophagales bacterium]
MNFLVAIITTSAGMMTTVSIITLLKSHIKGFIYKLYFNKRRKFSKANRRIVKIYQKFGMWGIALATPPLLTPIGGSIVAVIRGEPSSKILYTMFCSSIIWGFCGGGFIYFLYDIVIDIYHSVI